jgi:hypothetical protein
MKKIGTKKKCMKGKRVLFVELSVVTRWMELLGFLVYYRSTRMNFAEFPWNVCINLSILVDTA